MNLVKDDIPWADYVAGEEHDKCRPATHYGQALIDAMFGDEAQAATSIPLPWKGTEFFRLRAGEMTGWAGINGHGKSAMLSQVMLGAMRTGAKVFIASMEMQPVATMERMLRQAAASANPSMRYAKDFVSWTDDQMWLYDHQGSVSPEKMLGICRYVRQTFGVDHIVIDSLMKCKVGTDDYSAQKELVNDLQSFAMSSGAHVHLVMHMRKGERESDQPGKFDVKGASEIVDQLDNLVICWRNKRKEEEREKAARGSGYNADMMGNPDAILAIRKQRHAKGPGEGSVGLFYDPTMFQFHHSAGPFSPMQLGNNIDF